MRKACISNVFSYVGKHGVYKLLRIYFANTRAEVTHGLDDADNFKLYDALEPNTNFNFHNVLEPNDNRTSHVDMTILVIQ